MYHWFETMFSLNIKVLGHNVNWYDQGFHKFIDFLFNYLVNLFAILWFFSHEFCWKIFISFEIHFIRIIWLLIIIIDVIIVINWTDSYRDLDAITIILLISIESKCISKFLFCLNELWFSNILNAKNSCDEKILSLSLSLSLSLHCYIR